MRTNSCSLAFSILCGHTRYAHVNAVRFDAVSPAMLGMNKVVSEDSARRNLKKFDPMEARQWQRKHLRETWERLLEKRLPGAQVRQRRFNPRHVPALALAAISCSRITQ